MKGFLALAALAVFGRCAGFGQGIWETRAPYPIAATEVSAAAIDGKVYGVCGLTLDGSTNALFIYDPFTDAWLRGASIPAPGGDHCNAAAVNGKLYLLGGLGALDNGDTYEYDPQTDRWQVVGRMPTPRGASGVAAIGGRIYVAGGLAAGRSVATFEVFDTTTRQWTRLPDMPTARDHLTAQAVNGKFYAISGRAGDVLSVNEEYDPAANAWTRRAPIPTPRGGLGSGVLNGRIQVFGGEGPSGTPEGTYRQNEEYDPAADTWRSLTPMPVPRHGLYGATVTVPGSQGVVYTPSGGPRAGLFVSNVHEAFYLPPSAPPAIEAEGIRHAASLSRSLSPGTLVSLFGERLAPARQAAFRFPLPDQMSAVRVTANGAPLPLLFVSPRQINLHLPLDLPAGEVMISVSNAGAASVAASVRIQVDPTPGIFTLSQSGEGQGAILIAGTGLIAGQAAGVPSRLARAGEVLEIYCTGLGPVSSPPARGAPAVSSPLSRTLTTPAVTIGGVQAEVLFSGLTPEFVGLYQVNARIPAGFIPGPRVPVVVRLGDASSNTATIGVAETAIP